MNFRRLALVFIALIIVGGVAFLIWAENLGDVEMPSPRDYAPNFWFDSEEKYYPASPPSFYYDENLEEIPGLEARQNYDSLSLEEKLRNFTIFYKIRSEEGQWTYEYWPFYVFNVYDNVNDHYGDWEPIYVFVDKNSRQISKVVASAHIGSVAGNYLFFLPLSNNETGRLDSDHVRILVEKGSHANWPDGDSNGLVNGMGDVTNWYNAWRNTTWHEEDKLHGVKINFDNPNYKLEKLSDLQEKLKGKESLTKSPTLGFLPFKIGSKKRYFLPIGGTPCDLNYVQSVDDPERAKPITTESVIAGITGFGEMVWGKVKGAGQLVKDTAVGIFDQVKSSLSWLKNTVGNIFSWMKEGVSEFAAGFGLLFKGSEPKGEYIPLGEESQPRLPVEEDDRDLKVATPDEKDDRDLPVVQPPADDGARKSATPDEESATPDDDRSLKAATPGEESVIPDEEKEEEERVSGRVIINEIAWMGTQASYNDEWIELYNLETYAINLSGWVLNAQDGKPEIELSGEIPAQGYYLLERTDDNTVSDVPADQIYTGALSNDGENLILADFSGSIIDQVDCSEGWFAGENEGKKSMERSDQGGWHTNDGLTINGYDADGNAIFGTPKAENSAGQPQSEEEEDDRDLKVATPEEEVATPEEEKEEEEDEEEDDRGLKSATPVAKIVINEIMYDLEGADSGREWVEIYNAGESSVDLAGWRFYENETNHKLTLYQGEITMPPLGYALIIDEPEKFLADWPNFSGILFKSSFSLKNSGEMIGIRDAELNIIDEVNYSSEWGAKGNGHSLQRKNTFGPSSLSPNWHSASPTPGALNKKEAVGYTTPLEELLESEESEEGEGEAEEGERSGQVVINEIAWMGTETSHADEWIELKNLETYDINLSEWTLNAQDGSPEIELSGEIPAQGYYLLERTNDNTVSDVPADQIYTGALSNDGENLILKDTSGEIIDKVDCSDGWFAGENEGKRTMERGEMGDQGDQGDQGDWHTNDGLMVNGYDADGNAIFGTPKALNSEGEDEEEDDEGSGEEESGEEEGSGEGEPENPGENIAPTASFSYSPQSPLVDQIITFDAASSTDPNGEITTFFWDFGDSNSTSTTFSIITHSYATFGDYIVGLTVVDDKGATDFASSAVSVSAAEEQPEEDTTPPAKTTDLEAVTGSARGTIILSWTAPGDDEMNGTSKAYFIKYATSTITDWNLAFEIVNQIVPKSAGSSETFVVSNLNPRQIHYFAIKSQDEVGNISEISNIASVESSAKATHVVINEVQIFGRSSKDEFVELHNPTNEDIDLSGWSLKRKTKSGKEYLLVSSSKFSGIIPKEGYFLIAHPVQYTGRMLPDLEYSSADYGIADDNTVLFYNEEGILVDKVGMGDAQDSEGQSFPVNPPHGQSIERKILGWDTDNNAQDFILNESPTPQNSSGEKKPTIINQYWVLEENATATWTLDSHPYILESNSGDYPTVEEGAVLTIEPGVIIKSKNKYYPSLMVKGILKAQGTAEKPIIFTANTLNPEPGDWKGIVFDGSRGSILDYVKFEYGGFKKYSSDKFKEMVHIKNSSEISITNSTFRESENGIIYSMDSDMNIANCTFLSSKGGIHAQGNTTSNIDITDSEFRDLIYGVRAKNGVNLDLQDNLFTNIIGYPINIISAYPTLSGNVAENCGINGVYFDDDTVFGQDFTLKADLPYVFQSNALEQVTVGEGVVLTLEPGVVIKASVGRGHYPSGGLRPAEYDTLLVKGTLIAQGGQATSTKIIFTSLKDDEYGGDTNNDGASPTPGDWRRIVFASSSTGSVLDNVILRYGGKWNEIITIEAGAEADLGNIHKEHCLP